MSTFIAASSATSFRASSGVFGASTGPATKTRARSSAAVRWLSRAAKLGACIAAEAEDRRDAVRGVGAQIAS